jgi:hypothetical protein
MNAGQQLGALRALHQASSQLAAALGQIAGSDGSIVPPLYMNNLTPELRAGPKRFFVYRMDFLPVAAAGGTLTATFTVNSDSAFMVTSLAAEIHDPAAPGTPSGPEGLTIEITDAGSGRQLQNGPLGFGTIVGVGTAVQSGGSLPAYMPWPQRIRASSQVTASIVNNKLAQAVNIRLSFVGFKIFPPAQAGL